MEKRCGGMPGHEVNRIECIVDGPITELAKFHAKTGVWDGRMDRMTMQQAQTFWAVLRNMDRTGVVAR